MWWVHRDIGWCWSFQAFITHSEGCSETTVSWLGPHGARSQDGDILSKLPVQLESLEAVGGLSHFWETRPPFAALILALFAKPSELTDV